MSETVPCAVHLKDVFRREKGVDDPILAGVGMRVRAGTLVAVVGADGAGKTTLMRIMAGILQPTQGSVRVFGRPLDAEAQTNLGYMPQKFGLYEDLSVAENLALYADLFGLTEIERKERGKALLRMTGLAPFTERIAGRLSGGMKQKLGLACALLNHPKILLLDEPSVGVDPLSRRDLWRMLRAQVEAGMTVVAATTSMDEAALCDEVVILEEGRIRTAGTPDAIAEQAAGRTFLAVDSNSETPLRSLQAVLWDRADLVSDAVPAAGGVALVLRDGVGAKELSRAFPSVEMRPRTPTLEDGYLCGRERLLGAVPRAQVWPWLLEKRGGKKERSAICANNLVRRFGAFTAVDRTSFEVRPGEVFGLLGPNGAGKTTTFKMLCGLLQVTEGELSVAGCDVRRTAPEARERIGYMAQKFSLYPNLSVRQNLSFFAGAYGLAGRTACERIEQMLQAFGLKERAEDDAASLTGGYKQRLAMAAALMHRPEILFLDEPTSGADTAARRQFWRWMTALSEAGTTVVVTTHFMEEALYCDRILIQDAGKTLVLGTPEAVRAGASTIEQAFIDIVERSRLAIGKEVA